MARRLGDPGVLFRAQRRRSGSCPIAIAASVLLALPPSVWGSKDKRADLHQAAEASGVVLKIEANELTLQISGAPLVLATTEDYRDEVAVGSQVTAAYY